MSIKRKDTPDRRLAAEVLRALGCEPGTGSPNLDCVASADDLMWFWAVTRQSARRPLREAMFPTQSPREAQRALDILGSYAVDAACARTLRTEGQIERASKYEQAMEIKYQALPDWARW